MAWLGSLFKSKKPVVDLSKGDGPKALEADIPTWRTEARPSEHLVLSELCFGRFPTIDLEQRPKNREFAKVKSMYVDRAFEACGEHYRYLCNLQPVRNKSEIHKVFRYVIKEFLGQFWDMPASEKHHHSLPWGLVQHSLECACVEAEQWMGQIVYSDQGTRSSERTRKGQPLSILGGFLTGLFHDSGKIFDYQMYYRDPSTMVYRFNPFQGGILDFILTHPNQERIKTAWTVGRGSIHKRRNLFMFMSMLPRDMTKMVPMDTVMEIVDKLLSYEALNSDRMSVAADVSVADDLAELQKVVGERFLRDRTFVNTPGASPAFKIDNNYYMVIQPKFIQEMSALTGGRSDKELTSILMNSGMLIYDKGDNEYYRKVDVHIRPGKRATANNLNVSFIKAEFFDKPIMAATNGQAPEPSKVKIDNGEKRVLEDFFVGHEVGISDSAFYSPGQEKYEPRPGQGSASSPGAGGRGGGSSSGKDRDPDKMSDQDKAVAEKFNDFLFTLGKKHTIQGKGDTNVGFLNAKGELCILFPKGVEFIAGTFDMTDQEAKKKINQDCVWSLVRLGYVIMNDKNPAWISQNILWFEENALKPTAPTPKQAKFSFVKLDVEKLKGLVPEFAEMIKKYEVLNEAGRKMGG